ncbi:MAG: rhomboid family intramembrane serine protease [Chloroflexi bacterium]|nr:rhomboid family intramembrane serine protease [Chloroflexota bacterium]
MIPLSDENPSQSAPIITVALIAINILVFLYQISLGEQAETFIRACAFTPTELLTGQDVPPPSCVQPPYLTVFTSMFMHAGLLHIGTNMLYLWIFGNNVEDSMGSLKYLVFYVLGGVVAALTQTFMTQMFAPEALNIPNLGASGAVAAVLGAYLVLFPHARVRTLVILGFFISMARIPALIVLGLWFVLQFFQGVGALGGGETGGVAFWAHIGGFVTGLVLAKLLATQPRGRRATPVYRF